jgi:hypothetical protein
MSLYSLALFIHILGALGLFASTGVNHLVLVRLRRAGTVAQVRDLLEMTRAVATFEPVVALALLGAGLYLTATTWGWQVAWIDVSLGAVLALVAVGVVVGAPRVAARARAAADAPEGPIPAALAARIDDPVLWTLTRAALALQLGIVFLMTTKPGLAGSLATLGVALALGLISAVPGWRGAARTPHEGAGAPAEG